MRRLVPAVALTTLLLMAGCSGEANTEPISTGDPVSRMRVGLTEWAVTHQASPAAPGRLVLVVTNAGTAEHDLRVSGRLGEWETPLLRPGERYRLEVQAAAGERLHLDCDVPGHHSAGMHTTLPVVDPRPSGGDHG